MPSEPEPLYVRHGKELFLQGVGDLTLVIRFELRICMFSKRGCQKICDAFKFTTCSFECHI